MRIGILHHPKIPASFNLANDIDDWLQARGVDSWLGSSWNAEAIATEAGQLDILVALGGDGTLLRAGRLTARFEVPILGINLGRLGFLSEVQPEDWSTQLERVLQGKYWIERRMMLVTETWRDGQKIEQDLEGLNEVVVSRGSMARVVRISTEINDSYLTTYVADGVIVSTPTGSTAYALAAGGPILPPELQNILLLPIAPHLSLARPVVLDKGATVSLKVRTDHKAILTVDGQFMVDLQDGDRVLVASSPHRACFVRLQPRSYFYQTLMDRLRMMS